MFSLPYGENGWFLDLQDFYMTYKHYFRDVVMRFDMRDVSRSMLLARKSLIHKDTSVENVHAFYNALQKSLWICLENLAWMNSLRSLTIDISTLRCTMGCCRVAKLEEFSHFLFVTNADTGWAVWSEILDEFSK